YVNVDASYRYNRSAFDIGVHAFHTVDLSGGFATGGVSKTWTAETLGADAFVAYTFRRPLDSDTFGLGYTFAYAWKAEDLQLVYDPNDPPPVFPTTGRYASLRASWGWSNVHRFAYDVSASEGVALNVSVAAQHEVLGSQFPSISGQWAVQGYVRMPWERTHVLALRYSGGLAGGQPGHRDFFYVGGFPETS